jgi:hypothetical protein
VAIVGSNEERFLAAELYRLKAKARLMRGASVEEAKVPLEQALRTAREEQARSLELVPLPTWRDSGRMKAGARKRSTCSSVYGAFTEGFETRDLKEAKAVLVRLQESAG